MLRDDLMIVLPADVAAAFWASTYSAWACGTIRAAKAWHDLPQVCREFIDNFETDPETVIVLPDYIGVQIKRATLGELRQWRNTHAATTVASWRRFLDTFETIESGMSRVHRLQPMTRLERVKAGREKDPYCPLDPVYGNGIDLAPEFRLRPYREVLSLEVDDPTGDDIAADAPRRLFAGGGEP